LTAKDNSKDKDLDVSEEVKETEINDKKE
jgi:hypothetical protein